MTAIDCDRAIESLVDDSLPEAKEASIIRRHLHCDSVNEVVRMSLQDLQIQQYNW